jgi:peptidoglycan/LPS O-acetylase OafA/YrhL
MPTAGSCADPRMSRDASPDGAASPVPDPPRPLRPDRADNFLALRHVAALMVLWAHGYALSASGLQEPMARLLGGFDAGRCAVYLFFATSGYLIAGALVRDDRILRYVRHRVLRIYPAYAVCLLVCVFGFGAAFTTLPLGDYLRHPQTWSYFTANWLPLSMQHALPGVFEQHPYPDVVNGSLWSLGPEIRWYFFFGVLALIGLFRHRRLFTLVAALLIGDSIRRHGLAPAEAATAQAITQLFLLGALAAMWRERVPLSWPLFGLLVLSTALLLDTRGGSSLLVLCCVYGALCLALRTPPLRLRHGDWSYGLFLYGAPVQQSLVALWRDVPPPLLFLLGTAVTLGFAVLSWRLVEAPALRLKQRLDRRAPMPGSEDIPGSASCSTGSPRS